jgi:hypothetical protein
MAGVLLGRNGAVGRAVPLTIPFVAPVLIARSSRLVRHNDTAGRRASWIPLLVVALVGVEIVLLWRATQDAITRSAEPEPWRWLLAFGLLAALAAFVEPRLAVLLAAAALFLGALARADAGSALVWAPVICTLFALTYAIPPLDARRSAGPVAQLRQALGLPVAALIFAAPFLPLIFLRFVADKLGAARVGPRLALAEAPGYFEDGAWLERVRLLAAGIRPTRWIANAQSDAALFASRAFLGPLHWIFAGALAAIVAILGAQAIGAYDRWRDTRRPRTTPASLPDVAPHAGLVPLLLAAAALLTVLSYTAIHLLAAKSDWFPITGVPMPLMAFGFSHQAAIVASLLVASIECSAHERSTMAREERGR